MSVDNKLKREEYTLFKFKQLIESFVKNSTLCLYENIEDFIKDHNYLTKFENELKKVINDDDMYGCQTFEHLHNIKNKIINNIEIFDDEGIDKIKVKEEIVRSFLKNVVVNKESHKNEEN
jgi:hypothetical protein